MSALAEPQTELMRQHNRRQEARANIRARGEAYRIKREREEMLEHKRRNPSKPVVKFVLFDHHVTSMHMYREALLKSTKQQSAAISQYTEVMTPQSGYIPRVKMADIALRVSKNHNGITLKQLRSLGRHRPFVIPRQEFCYLAIKAGHWTYTQVAKFIRRDHTTVLHAVKMHCYRNGLIHPTTGEKVTAKMVGISPKKNGAAT